MEKINEKEKSNILHIGSKKLSSENWKVYHPSGRHMFTCGEKKAEWYVERDLAVIIGEGMIQLTFEPKGNGFEDNEDFGRSSRIVRCVVTGSKVNLQRHHIVPYCYRTYFPEAFKSKNHHDVVLMNFKIHSDYEQQANLFKDEIARIYDVKTIGELNAEYTYKLRELGKPNAIILNTIHSLFKSYGKLTHELITEKLQYISENSNLPYDVLSGYSYVQLYKLFELFKSEHLKELVHFKLDNRMQYDHGYHVAQKLDTDEKIEEFVKLWRNHFINTMHPKYMPFGWSVDFRFKTKI
jgi:hypothetical protein